MEHDNKDFRRVIEQMLTPMRGLPFSTVIESLCGKKVIPFDRHDPADIQLLERLSRGLDLAQETINQSGIVRRRANEVGNDIEPYVQQALIRLGTTCAKPRTASGRNKSAGYPDLMCVDKHGRCSYLECKTYNEASLNTTFRSFYLSPSDDFKVTADAHHFAVSFQIEVAAQQNANNVYKCCGWKILDLCNLIVDIKYEFNSDNRRLYDPALILAQK